MVEPQLHRAHLLAVATDPQKMEAIKEPLERALSAARTPDLDIEKAAILIGIKTEGDTLYFVTEIIEPSADSAAMRSVLTTLHLVSLAIFDLVKDASPEDEVAFDKATARARDLLRKHNIDPLLDVILVETAIAAIHAEASADALVITLYSDGRLMALKGSLLSRLLKDHQAGVKQRASA